MFDVGCEVEHSDFGIGTVVRTLGSTAEVNFIGEIIAVSIKELIHREGKKKPTVSHEQRKFGDNSKDFRKAFEAMNLGVVPPSPEQLISLTIGGVSAERKMGRWLDRFDREGLCKVYFGYYGSGKSHNLHLANAIALKRGWVTSFLEIDPKSVDPAKPHLMYAALMSSLTFPVKDDGSQTQGIFQFFKEIRDHWTTIREGAYLRRSQWFLNAIGALMRHPHDDREEYLSGVSWLFGQLSSVSTIRSLASSVGLPGYGIPPMPRVRETSEIYVFHLVVISEICRALGYKGLAIILDEAEHVRGYNVNRRERANNFFDYLARAAYSDVPSYSKPANNEFGLALPRYWKEGPHYALLVGLTEGDAIGSSGLSAHDDCVFLHADHDAIRLSSPSPRDYIDWCEHYFELCSTNIEGADMLGSEHNRLAIAKCLGKAFAETPAEERTLRLWMKLASFVPCVLVSKGLNDIRDLMPIVERAAASASGYELPWQ